MLLVWDQTSFTEVTPGCHLDIQVSLGLVKKKEEELPQNISLEQAVLAQAAHKHSHVSGTTATTRGQTVAELPEEESSVFLSLPKEWEAKAVLCK